MLLNTDSALNVRFDARQRLLLLERGEILLSTAHDARPLRVRSHEALFEALGTRFVLRQERAETQLSVEQGAVAIAPLDLEHGSTVAEAGQRFRVTRHGAQAIEQQSMDSAAWADGMIVTRDMRLADFLAEIGRYRHGHLGCTEAVADLRLSGVYRLDDTDNLLDLLPRTLPVRVLRRTPWWVTVEAHS
ncbi:MAG: Protein FecR [Pseudomonas citronellolis]|nr:MAG: Protein FecR [Pseudomonas citronellolis]